MAINQLAAALLLTIITGPVLADTPLQTSSTSKTRAEVVAELTRARANGELNISDADYPPLPKFVSTKTRAQVIAELVEARARGELIITDVNYPYTPPFFSTKTRAEIQAELVEYKKHHDTQSWQYQGY